MELVRLVECAVYHSGSVQIIEGIDLAEYSQAHLLWEFVHDGVGLILRGHALQESIQLRLRLPFPVFGKRPSVTLAANVK